MQHSAPCKPGLYGYRYYRCRCDMCVDAKRLETARRKRKARPTTRSAIERRLDQAYRETEPTAFLPVAG